jgi:hypothetical protein
MTTITTITCPISHEHGAHLVSVNMGEPFTCPGLDPEAIIKNFDAATGEFMAALGRKFPDDTWTANVGRRFTRIVRQDAYGSRSSYCFIERANGDVLKCAGWKAPAEGARGSIATPEALNACIERADRFGSWLYR